jgi:Fe-S cluster biogenesis protein NfuA
MANVTLKQGIEALIREAVPEIHQVVDTTDHARYQPVLSALKGRWPVSFA